MIQKAVHELVKNKNPDFETTKEVMDEIVNGSATQAQISSFLTALRMKGEIIDGIATCATVMRDKAVKLSLPLPIADIVGIRGDEVGTFNISTTSIFATTAGGIQVAKHGNRSISSKGGVADVLERLGAELALTAQQAGAVSRDTGMCSLLVLTYHSSAKYAVPVRKGIGIRSIFSILDPLSNLAIVSMQLLGVYSRDSVGPLAQVLANLGIIRGMVVCGEDGLDEATLTGSTHVYEIRYGKIMTYDMMPEELGLAVCSLEGLIGGTPEENAKIAGNILSGSLKGPKRDVVVLNTAISLYLGTDDRMVRDYIETAQDIINSEAAMAKMEEFIQATEKAAGEVRTS